MLKNPFPNKKDFTDKAALRAANEEVKGQRRHDLWSFTDPGMPGEAGKHLLLMEEILDELVDSLSIYPTIYRVLDILYRWLFGIFLNHQLPSKGFAFPLP